MFNYEGYWFSNTHSIQCGIYFVDHDWFFLTLDVEYIFIQGPFLLICVCIVLGYSLCTIPLGVLLCCLCQLQCHGESLCVCCVFTFVLLCSFYDFLLGFLVVTRTTAVITTYLMSVAYHVRVQYANTKCFFGGQFSIWEYLRILWSEFGFVVIFQAVIPRLLSSSTTFQ